MNDTTFCLSRDAEAYLSYVDCYHQERRIPLSQVFVLRESNGVLHWIPKEEAEEIAAARKSEENINSFLEEFR